MQDARVSGASSQYFLGSIVLIKNDREPKSSVVDGQQRLSTLTMLFAVLREAMPHAADDITDFLYKKGKVSLGEKNEYCLTAREEDADYFRANIQELGGIAQLVTSTDKLEDSRLRYRENATLLLAKAKALPPADLIALWQFLANDCSLVVISTPDLEAAYRIFSVLNNRGLDLAPIDILKAQVLGLIRTTAGDAKSSAYAKEWSRIESALGRDAFGDLFGHIRTIYAKQKQWATLVKEFQEHVTEYKAPIDLVDKVTYFLLVTKVGINERIETYAALTKEIEPTTFDGDVAALKTLILTDKQQREFVAALDGDIYRNLPKARMALVLRLESLVRAPGVRLEDAVSLEHVLPQTPPDGSDWIKWFPEENKRDGWTHRLANLVPLDRNKNSSASNYDFAKKKDAYFVRKGKASPFVLTQEVRSENEWTGVLQRQRIHAGQAQGQRRRAASAR